ncbi:hypothetical protein BASA62_003376 [Batrachochytrium salamandrivorans]|nr:hypothetical protein BASA62_003376 [Batrachochytrium salamandrivorans]
MLSKLTITFLCAATIGSVSDAFLTFKPEQILFQDIVAPISLSVQLKSKPTEAVTVHLEHPFMSMSTCVIVFNPENWNVAQKFTAVPAPLFLGSSNPPKQLAIDSEILAKAVTAGPLPEELSSIYLLKVTRITTPPFICSAIESKVLTLDGLGFSFSKPGWYQMMFTRDMEVQVFIDKCKAETLCVTKVLARYGSSVISIDGSGPVKGVGEYLMKPISSKTDGIRYSSNPNDGKHKMVFPYGSILNVKVVNRDGIVSLDVESSLVSGYTAPGGFCNIPRLPSTNNKFICSDGKLYGNEKVEEVAAFANSWSVNDADVLTNPSAKTLNLPSQQQPGTVCKSQKKPHPKPPKPPPPPQPLPPPTTTSTSYSTVKFPKYVSSFTVKLSTSTSPSSTSTTAPYFPAPNGYVPPAPNGYAPSSPPAPNGQAFPGSLTPNGQVLPGSLTPNGQVLPGSLAPNGDVSLASLTPNGDVSLASLTPNGQVLPGSLDPNGQVLPGSLTPNGQVLPGSLTPNGYVPSAPPALNGQVPPAPLDPNGQALPGPLAPDGQVLPGSLTPNGQVLSSPSAPNGQVPPAPLDPNGQVLSAPLSPDADVSLASLTPNADVSLASLSPDGYVKPKKCSRRAKNRKCRKPARI